MNRRTQPLSAPRSRPVRRAGVVALLLCIPVGLALAQRALDANLQVGSGGFNSYNRSAFPSASPSPYTVNRRTGEMSYNWASAVNERPGGAYSSALRRSGGDLAFGRGDFAPSTGQARMGASGLAAPRYSASTYVPGLALESQPRRPAQGAAGLQAPRYSAAAPGLAPVGGATGASGLQRGTYKPATR